MTKMEKFLFNQHIFDEPEEDEEELEEEPPPPTFSEEELEEARKTAYEQAYKKGRDEALEEAKASRGQQIANVLQKISVDTGLIFAAEHEREQVFEEEVIRVCLAIFEKLYPVLMETQGRAQMQAIIADVLHAQDGKSEIQIETSSLAAEGIEAFLSKLALANNAQERLVVKENPALDDGACLLQWKDGGAVRDAAALAEQIKTLMENALSDDKKQESQENTHEIPPNDAIMEDNEPDSDGPAPQESDDKNIEENTAPEDLEKPDE